MTVAGARMIHIDLATAPEDWTIEADGRRAFVVVWWRSVPLGSFLLEPAELPMATAAVADRAAVEVARAAGNWVFGAGFEATLAGRPLALPASSRGRDPAGMRALLASLDEALEPREAGGSLGVIICTRDRPQPLARCLAAIAASHVPADQVLVVDNAPASDEARQVVAAHPGVEYLREDAPGLSRARNAGLRACRTDLVAFTDDDAAVHPLWTTRVRHVLVDASVAAMTGLVLPASLDNEAEWLFETAFGGFSQGFRPFDADARFVEATRASGVPTWRLGAGANMAFRRSALIDAGGFDERLGAGAAGCSEDSEAWYRLLRRGQRIRYDPRAVVFHAHRADVASLHRQMYLYMRGHVAALCVQFERSGDWGNLRRLFLAIPKYYLERVLRRLTSRPDAAAGMLGDEMKGALAGIGYYVAHARDARGAVDPGTTGST